MNYHQRWLLWQLTSLNSQRVKCSVLPLLLKPTFEKKKEKWGAFFTCCYVTAIFWVSVKVGECWLNVIHELCATG